MEKSRLRDGRRGKKQLILGTATRQTQVSTLNDIGGGGVLQNQSAKQCDYSTYYIYEYLSNTLSVSCSAI
jgi:hypothetical protein